jgi:GNAT superfamily N-acetyltransferase
MEASTAALIRYRKAWPDDFDDIAHVWYESARHLGAATTIEQLRARIDVEVAAKWDITVATQNGNIVAFLAVNPDPSILDQLFVLPAKQGQGIGFSLLQWAMRAMPTGFKLRSASANQQARHFYEREGLRLLEEGLHPGKGHPVCYYGWNPTENEQLPTIPSKNETAQPK